MSNENQMNSDLLKRTIIMIAAGGDASRFVLPKHQSQFALLDSHELHAPMWLRQHSMATETLPLGDLGTYKLIEYIFGVVREMQYKAGLQVPVAVITGPNNHTVISDFLHQTTFMNELNACVIQQDALPVFTQDGMPIFWEDGTPLEAPDGTAGCLAALERSDWFGHLVDSGYEYVFIWYVNDLSSGTHFLEFVEALANSDAPFTWFSDERGSRALRELAQVPFASQRPDLVVVLEDAPGAYVFRIDSIDEALGLVEEHAVCKDVPVLLPDGHFLKGVKREKFLSDAIRKSHLLEFRRNRARYMSLKPGDTLFDRWQITGVKGTEREPVYLCTDLTTGEQIAFDMAESSKGSRSKQETEHLLSRMEQSLELGSDIVVTDTEIGERHVGDFLVDSYEIVEVKHGTFGIVYICRDHDTNELVAVKTYTDEIRWSRSRAVQRFWHEANQWLVLPRHPNIVTASHVREIDGRLHIFLEYVDGGNLRTRLQKGSIAIHEVLEIGIQVCQGLQVIHAHGMIHRDIKPENILLTKDGIVKVTDLGLVATLYDKRLKEPAGTRGYRAPEQIVSPEEVSTSADIYAMGVVLYEMLADVLPEGTVRPSIELNPQIPETLSNLVMACLALNPASRPTATELAKSLVIEYRSMTDKEYKSHSTVETEERSLSERINRVNSLVALGRQKDALELCESLIRANPQSRNVRYSKALVLYDLQRYQECAALCLEIFEMAYEHFGGATNDQVGLLLDMCSIWLGVSKGDAEQWAIRGQLAAQLHGDSTMGLKFAEISLKIDPNCHTAWFLKGQFLYNLGRYEEAVACYEKAAEASDHQRRVSAVAHKQRCQTIIEGRALPLFRFQQLTTAGRRCIESGKFKEAEEHYRNALKICPDDADALSELGIVLCELGRPSEAIDYYDRAITADSSDATTWYNKGRALQLLNRLVDALDCYEEALRLSPDDYKSWNNKATCLFEMRRFQEAKSCFERALQLNPASEKAREGIALCEERLAGKVEKEPADNRDYWMLLGIAYCEQENLREALACFKTALQIDPECALAWYNAGYVLWMLGQHHAALNLCDRALAIDPNLVHAWNIRGNALDDLGRTEEALESYEKAIALDDQYYEAWNGRGLILKAMGRDDEALQCFDKACSINAKFVRGLSNKADILCGRGKHEGALACYDEILSIDPNHKRAWQWKGTELFHLQRFEEAAESYQRAVELDQNNFEGWNNLGGAQAMLGQIGEAMKSFRRALAIKPDFGPAHKNLERMQRISRGIAP